MSRFVITITPDNADAGASNTTVRVDTSSGQAKITELTVRAADGGGLAPADLPAVDLDLLIRALAAPSGVQALTAAETTPTSAPTDLRSAMAESATSVEHVESVPAATVEAVVAEEPAPATGRRGRKATARKSTAKKVAAKKATPRKSAAAKNTTTAKKATKAARRSAADAGAEATAAPRVTGRRAAASAAGRKATADRTDVRAYRRMPESDEVMAAYTQAGSITGLAEHFGVPRHTANGWARRLRQQGHSIGRA